MEEDPTFATGFGTSTIDHAVDRKILDKYSHK
jgi:hypothetical protein